MMKKAVIIGVLSLLAVGAASANGFYAGFGAGMLQLNDKLIQTADTTTVKVDEGKLGVNGELMGGYHFAFANRLLLNVEAFGNYTSANVNQSVSSSSGNSDTKTRLQYVYGARVMPGFQATDSTAFYGILGVARGYFRNSGVLADAVNGTYSLNGYQLGLATMTDVSQHIAIRTDLIYTGYQSKTYYNINGYDNSLRYEPSTIEFNVAAVYKFG